MSVEIDLSGNVALVTGANSPIGLAIASELKKAGAELVLATHNSNDNVKSLTNSIPAKILSADLRNPHEIEKLIFETFEINNQLDIIVNNAALQNVQKLSEINSDNWDAVLETNLRSIHLLMRAAIPALGKSKNASVVNVASIEGHQPARGHSHYSTSKAGLLMLTKSAALEYADFGIRVNSVSPGLIDDGNLKERWPEGLDRWLDSVPLGRVGTPRDIADAVVFLSSPMARWITGSDLLVDGGVSTNATW
jgi:NAD(P)-dependent dehydrogenase (short-subunit alcohol dehydrogenase family)